MGNRRASYGHGTTRADSFDLCAEHTKDVGMADRTNRWEDYRDRYCTDWEGANPGRSWDETEHSYRYGWESAQDQRFSGRNYADVENGLQQGWSDYDIRYHINTSGTLMERGWDNLKDNVRHGWERAKQEVRDTF